MLYGRTCLYVVTPFAGTVNRRWRAKCTHDSAAVCKTFSCYTETHTVHKKALTHTIHKKALVIHYNMCVCCDAYDRRCVPSKAGMKVSSIILHAATCVVQQCEKEFLSYTKTMQWFLRCIVMSSLTHKNSLLLHDVVYQRPVFVGSVGCL